MLLLIAALSLCHVEPQGPGVQRIDVASGARFIDGSSCSRWLMGLKGQGSVSDGSRLVKMTPDVAVFLPAGSRAHLSASSDDALSVLQIGRACELTTEKMHSVRLSDVQAIPVGGGEARVLDGLAVLDLNRGTRLLLDASTDRDDFLLVSGHSTTIARGASHSFQTETAARLVWVSDASIGERVETLRVSALVSPTVEAIGGIDPHTVKQVVEASGERLSRCAELDLKGRVRIAFTIAKDGTVVHTETLRNDAGRASVGLCLERALAGISFAKRSKPTFVSYPFIFGVSR